ncbi:MAG: hypothetical protein ACRC8S_23260 [Fimbriiglobus sp.]
MVLRLCLLTVWLLAALGVGVYHLSAGEQKMKLDAANQLLIQADAAGKSGDYAEAITLYDQALAAIPAERKDDSRKIRVEKAKAQMLANKLPEAHADLKVLVDELTADKTADAKVLSEARSTLANAQYYTTWLMRLEGLGEEEWLPEIDAARQNYKLLAEQGTPEAQAIATEDLEAAIRLARMSLNDLQAMPLPKQCKGCCSCKSNRPSKKQGPKKEKQDVRSAGGSPPIEDGGH